VRSVEVAGRVDEGGVGEQAAKVENLEWDLGESGDLAGLFELDAMALAVVEADRADGGETAFGPIKTGDRVLPAGKQDERGAGG
jgi:hypothetical protein